MLLQFMSGKYRWVIFEDKSTQLRGLLSSVLSPRTRQHLGTFRKLRDLIDGNKFAVVDFLLSSQSEGMRKQRLIVLTSFCGRVKWMKR